MHPADRCRQLNTWGGRAAGHRPHWSRTQRDGMLLVCCRHFRPQSCQKPAARAKDQPPRRSRTLQVPRAAHRTATSGVRETPRWIHGQQAGGKWHVSVRVKRWRGMRPHVHIRPRQSRHVTCTRLVQHPRSRRSASSETISMYSAPSAPALPSHVGRSPPERWWEAPGRPGPRRCSQGRWTQRAPALSHHLMLLNSVAGSRRSARDASKNACPVGSAPRRAIPI